MDCDKGFSSNYMILKPEEVSFIDLIHILFSSNIEKRKFVDSSEVKEESFKRRWLIFLSIVVQKTLRFVAKPLSCVGSGVETWLNLVACNRNILVLILNFFKGKVIYPVNTSETFVSFTGNIDKRVELDKSIKHGDGKYHAALSAMAAKASYENEAYIKSTVIDHWKMEFLGYYDFWNDYRGKVTTQAFMLRDRTPAHDTIVVAFRGTEPFNSDDWCSDFDISWYELEGVGKIHGGFMKALGLQKSVGWPKEIEEEEKGTRPGLAYYTIRRKLKELLAENKEAKYIVTGHSLGGALAILFPAVLALHKEKLLLERLEGVYTFGQPRVGDENFGEFMEKQLKENDLRYSRFVYGNDMFARLPYDDEALMFKHFGKCLYFDRYYLGKVVDEEPNKNYFSPMGAIPMMINAFFEIVRSFTITHKKGKEYKEGSLLRVFRIIGLVIPGISAHSTQDYVNSTRLGQSDLFILPSINQEEDEDEEKDK